MGEQRADVSEKDKNSQDKPGKRKINIEVEIEDREYAEIIEVENKLSTILKKVCALTGLEDVHVFERDEDEPIGKEIEKRKALRLVAHRVKAVLITIQFEHREIQHSFPPSATVFRVLQRAVGKKGFNLDHNQQSKANLMLPGTDEPLSKDSVIGRYVHGEKCVLTLVLTLRDFTNG